MKPFQTILVSAALDDRDTTTMRHAARFAQGVEAKTVYVAHVAPTFDLPAQGGGKEPELAVPVDEEIDQKLRAIIEAQRSLFPAEVVFHCVERQGALATELIRLAAQKNADLVCLGRRAAQGHDSLSESAMRLVRKSPCSVLIVPPGVEARYDRIVVPVDFSDHSRAALSAAFAIAQSMPGATVTALHIYSVPLGWHKGPHSYEEFAAVMKGHAERNWNAFLATVDTLGVPWTVRFELEDDVLKAIVAVADEIDASLLVLGSHGRTRPAGILLGHVADTVCAGTARAVLCVKRKGEVVSLLRALLQFFEFAEE